MGDHQWDHAPELQVCGLWLPRLRCGCWEVVFGPSPNPGGREAHRWPRHSSGQGRVWPVLLADCAQGAGGLLQPEGKLHGHEMLQCRRLLLLREERHLRPVCKDLLSEREQPVPSRERNSATGARLFHAQEIALLFLGLYREHWFAQTELRIGSLDWAVCEEGEHLRLRQVRGLRRCGGVSGWRLLDKKGDRC